MKKNIIGFLCFLFIFSFLSSCRRDDNALHQEDQQNGSMVRDFKGDFVSFQYTGDWEIREDENDKSLVLKIMGDQGMIVVLVKAERDRFNPAIDSANHFAQIYEGTPAKQMNYGQNEYYGTSFFLSMPQTLMVTKSGDYRVLVTLQGEGHDQDERVIDLLNTLEFSL